jgi:hypothetical protein
VHSRDHLVLFLLRFPRDLAFEVKLAQFPNLSVKLAAVARLGCDATQPAPPHTPKLGRKPAIGSGCETFATRRAS